MNTALENLRGKLVDLGTAAQAVGLDHHWRELAAHRQRVHDSHAAMSESAGFEASESDMGGDLTITGDVQIAPPGQPAQSKGVAKAAIAATVGAALASGAMVAANQLSDPGASPPVADVDTDTDTDTRNTIRFAD